MLCTFDPPVVPNSKVDIPASRFYEDFATITCNEGFEYPDGSVQQQVQCLADADFQTYWTKLTHTACQRKYHLKLMLQYQNLQANAFFP